MSPFALVVAIAVLSALVRFAVALHVRTPIIYPDEYLYTALSRGIDHGHFAQIRGGHVSYLNSSYLGPLLMAPLWLLSNLHLAYRLSQALGAVAFAASVFPAYGIARRLGISGRGAALAALVTVAVPSGVYTSMLLSEPLVYPLFLLAVYAALEAIAAPRPARQAGAIALGLVLSVAGGLQFLYFVPACLAAYLLAGASSLRGYLWRSVVIVAGVAYAVHAVEIRGFVRLDYSLGTLASWFAVNLLVFAMGAGWVVVPGGFAGVWRLGRGGDRRGRAFALLTAILLGAMLLEATVWSASGQGVYERFVFYGTPLLVIALIWAVESRALVRRDVAVVAYLAALGAAVLPVLRPLHGAVDEHAPALHALSNLSIGERPASIVWGPALVVLALLVAGYGASAGRRLIVAGAAICVALSVGASIAYIRHQPDTSVPIAHAPDNSTLVTWHDGDAFTLMKVLFWNPAITRVVVLGPGGGASDGFPSVAAILEPVGGLRTSTGAPVRGPFVFGPDTTVTADASPRSGLAVLPEAPSVIAFGFYNESRYLAEVGRIFAVGGDRGSSVSLLLHSPHRTTKRISVRCTDGFRRDIEVGPHPVSATIPVPRREVRSCWFALTRGAPEHVDRFYLGVKGTISGGPDRSTPPGEG